jgi:16S rRNA (guanine966-N2)-methyltransferase
LSRGAAHATFVEHDRDACRVIGANLDQLELKAIVLQLDAVRALQQERRTYDLVLCDPPYDYEPSRLAPHLPKVLTDSGLLVWESSSREPAPEVTGLQQRTTRTYGSARLTLLETC